MGGLRRELRNLDIPAYTANLQRGDRRSKTRATNAAVANPQEASSDAREATNATKAGREDDKIAGPEKQDEANQEMVNEASGTNQTPDASARSLSNAISEGSVAQHGAEEVAANETTQVQDDRRISPTASSYHGYSEEPSQPTSPDQQVVAATSTLPLPTVVTVHESAPVAPTFANFDSIRRECIVCLDVHSITQFPHLQGCEQEAETCRNCFTDWLANKVGSTGSLSQIQCPCASQKCKIPFTWDNAQEYATPEVFERYDRLMLQETLRDDPAFRYCIARDCPYGQIHDQDAGNIFICGSCGHRHCTTHHITFHDGESCEQYDERMRLANLSQAEQEEASKEELEKNSKQCPGSNCGYWIQKTSGCDHMTCTRCGFQFCYRCSAPYKGDNGINRVGNNAHGLKCPHHSDNLRSQLPNGLVDARALALGRPSSPATNRKRRERYRASRRGEASKEPEGPSIGGKAPPVGGKAPSVGGKAPSVGGKAPSIGGKAPSIEEKAPSKKREGPSNEGKAPSKKRKGPSTFNRSSNRPHLLRSIRRDRPANDNNNVNEDEDDSSGHSFDTISANTESKAAPSEEQNRTTSEGDSPDDTIDEEDELRWD